MRHRKWLGCLLILITMNCHAINEIRMIAPINQGLRNWAPAAPSISSWTNTAQPAVCSNWAPDVSTVDEGTVFIQTSNDCLQSQERTIQAREQNRVSLVFRDVGAPVIEPRTLTLALTRSALGTRIIEHWVDAPPLTSPWQNTADPLICTTWIPNTSTVNLGASFQQTSNDCLQKQEQTIQAREQDTISLAFRNKGVATVATQTVTISSSRTAIGTNPIDLGDYLVSAGNCCSGQHGFIPNNAGAIISVSNPDYVLNYLVVKSEGTLYIGFNGVTTGNSAVFLSTVKSVNLDFLDINKNVIISMGTDTNTLKITQTRFIGWIIPTALRAKTLSSNYIRLHIEFN